MSLRLRNDKRVYPFRFRDRSIPAARIRQPKHTVLWRCFMMVLYLTFPLDGKTFHGYIWIHLIPFHRFLRWFYTFSTKIPPASFPGGGTAQGAVLLTNFERTAIIKTERALPLVAGSLYQLIMFMLTVWLHPGGQHAFMESASAKNATHTRNFKRNLSTPASPPSILEFARG